VDEKEFEAAEQIVRRFTEEAPDRTYGWILLAHVMSNSERWQESIDASKKALEIDENEYNSWLYLADTHLGLKNYIEAETAIEKALQIQDNNGNAWYLKSKILMAKGMNDEAKAAMEKADLFGYEP
jgi:tetratricopeptide (TPR) repeat protein